MPGADLKIAIGMERLRTSSDKVSVSGWIVDSDCPGLGCARMPGEIPAISNSNKPASDSIRFMECVWSTKVQNIQ